MLIEKVTTEDAEELLSIYGPYVLNTAISFECEVPSAEEFKSRIKNISEKLPYIKAVEDGKIIGYAYAGSFKPRKAYDCSVETTVYVKEDCHGRGVGRALYQALEKSLKAINITNMNACIAFPKGEDPYLTEASPKFHRAMGFETVAHFHDCACKFGRWYDMIWMEKIIGEHSDNPKEILFGQWTL